MSKITMAARFIQNNVKDFVQGAVFKNTEMLKVFGIKEPNYTNVKAGSITRLATNYTGRKASMQRAFNDVLAKRGMFMSQSGDNYRIRTLTETKAKVVSFKTVADNASNRAADLNRGIKQFRGVWSPLAKSEV